MEWLSGQIGKDIAYKVYTTSPDSWKIEMIHSDGRILTYSWPWAYEPRCGIDVIDAQIVDEMVDKLVNILGGN